ncbi:hypothetical protein C1E23_19715 [Pseudoalteromonas phenolica]|uniref:histidine kinase n=1 Tax=Pseudoalteromonas phenolica TaxID=161398 RepID=A0A4V2EJ79_9GAMM|nr:HAMP domain-containing protein [Pseudoalteromonas phenolica]RZQ51408.1 hypothetical protein C1E23_19715 [Pseudoalteromonas phenolica]
MRQQKEDVIFKSIVITLCVSLIVIIIMALLIQRWLTRPITLASYVATEISNGNLDNHIVINSQDEIGNLLRALDRMQANKCIANEKLTQQMLEQKIQAE